ncbi:MAG: PHP domain-containing protein [bacterium]
MKKTKNQPRKHSTIKADLHLHSRFSDGKYQPQQLVRMAAETRLKVISLTDHDTINGLEQARRTAQKYNCLFIPGVELEAFFETNKDTYSLHILGYNIDYENKKLQKSLKKMHEARRNRARQILGKLSQFNIDLPMEKVLEFARGDLIGRVHIAQALQKLNFVQTMDEAFDRYIGDDSPAYVPKDVHTPAEIIELIHNSGGLAIWAHPYYTENDALLHPLVEMGLDGLECYHREFTHLQKRHYLNLARKHNLIVSGGSDYHGTLEEDFKLGDWWIELEKDSRLIPTEKQATLTG